MLIDYRKVLNETLLEFVKNVLLIIQKEGLNEEQSCYITFLTSHPHVMLSKEVKNKYPNEITIILQHQFEELQIYDNYFSVKLKFNDIEETVKVPLNSIVNFSDPGVNFYLKFNPTMNSPSEVNLDLEKGTPVTQEDTTTAIDENKIIDLERFRNKNKIN